MSDPLIQAIENAIDNATADLRAVVPGKVSKVTRTTDGERDVDFDPGIGKRQGGEERADGTVPSAAVLTLGGGGFSMMWPLVAEDEGLGLVVDRNVQRWRQNREVGQAQTFERSHSMSDLIVLPFTFTASDPAPASPGDDWILTGPQGEALRVAGSDGAVTVTRNGSTIELLADGNINITVGDGKSVNIGGIGAAALALGQKVIDAIDAMLAGGTPTPNDGGAGLLSTMTAAWELVKNTILALKAKGI